MIVIVSTAPAPMPCTARATMIRGMIQAMPQSTDPATRIYELKVFGS